MRVNLKSQQGLSFTEILKYFPALDYYDLYKVKEERTGFESREIVGIDIDSVEELPKLIKDLDLGKIQSKLTVSVSDDDTLVLTIMDFDWCYKLGEKN